LRNPINNLSSLVKQLFFYLCQNFEHLFIKLPRLPKSTYYLNLLPLYQLAIFVKQTSFVMCFSRTSTFFEQVFLITAFHTQVHANIMLEWLSYKWIQQKEYMGMIALVVMFMILLFLVHVRQIIANFLAE
jgi:hypothetical protein